MKFVKLIKYVENSYGDKPSFLILMDDSKEYISNGCQFIENTPENIKFLEREFKGSGEYLKELFSSKQVILEEVTSTRWMFDGCTSLAEFKGDMPNVADTRCMFEGCTALKSQ